MTARIAYLQLFLFCFFVPFLVFAQGNSALPVATTIVLEEAAGVGEVVIFVESENAYALATSADDARVYGITAERPAVVFTTASGTVPVVTFGTAVLKVSEVGGSIERGDVLVTSAQKGAAMKASDNSANAFAIALESSDTAATRGTIAVEINPEKAKALHTARIAQVQAEKEAGEVPVEEEPLLPFSPVRAAIAAVIAVGALFFILYSFRSTIAKGVVSVGRNPRATTSIMTFAVGNIVFALILCGVALFVAIAVLVLPVP